MVTELEYQRLPNWVLELVADLQEYEDTHPAAAPGEPILWCMQPILDKVPEGVRTYAEGFRRAHAEQEDPGTLTGGQLCGGSEQPSTRPKACPYTFAHTRHWCGYDGCRDS